MYLNFIMDSTLNDFLNEINEIVPLKNTNTECEWKECFDAKSGFAYYWNTKTDEVTWEEPNGFVPTKASKTNSPKAPMHPSVLPELMSKVKDPTKIYKISANQNTPILTTAQRKIGFSKPNPKKPPPKFSKRNDSDDEKITLISSYGSESESEDENEKITSSVESPRSTNRKEFDSDDEDSDILSTVRKRAEMLQKLGQADVKNIPRNREETIPNSKPKPPLSGFSLVAGYDSNSEEEEEENAISVAEKIDESIDEQKTVSHSTLFPIVKPPDVNDFIEKVEPEAKPENKIVENPFDTKTFQRKRRLAVSFVPTQKTKLNLPSPNTLEGERKGLGFSSNVTNNDNSTTNSSKSFYPNFARGGVEFVQNNNNQKNEDSNQHEERDVNMEEIGGIYEVLHEKLAFLCEGNKDVMPVQIILIQIETLFGALKANSLEPSYLRDWLEGTCEDLLKLEKDAAPDGWLLQWDRSQKRYYYHNQSTGEGRWDYPQADVVRQEEAMDICTTPPPPEDIEQQPAVEERPPLPPSPPARSPSPPPPPIISRPEPQPIPEPPVAPKIVSFETSDQPPPPGVDCTESTEYKPKVHLQENNDINSAFDSFYSELAAIESTSNAPSPSEVIEQTQKTDVIQEPLLGEPLKKKKKKVKLGQGLSLKKKDVSKLVEKWKNVQKNF